MNEVAEIIDLEFSEFDLEQNFEPKISRITTQFPLVSIIVPVYNGSKYIKIAIESIFEQTYRNYEVIVVDDGSTDNTREILKPYEDRIYYLYQANEGSASARNLGIKVAKGELIAFLDADDYWSIPEKLTLQVACFNEEPMLGCVNTGWRIVNGDNEHIKTVQPWHKAPELNLETWLKRKCVRTSAMIFRREWLEKVGGFDEELKQSHDVDLILRLSLAGCKFTWLKEDTVCYRQHEANTTKNSVRQAKYVRAVLDKFFANQNLPEHIREAESQTRYHTLVWLAWYQYRANNLDMMSELLQKSLDVSPYLRVENIAHWITSFERFSKERGQKFDADSLTGSREWQKLTTITLKLLNIDNNHKYSVFQSNVAEPNQPSLSAEQNINDASNLLKTTQLKTSSEDKTIINSEPVNKYQIVGEALLRQGYIKEAMKCYKTAVEINPELIKVHDKLIAFLLKQGDLDAAIASCETVLRYNSQDYNTIEKLADALFQRGNDGDLSKAAEYYEQIIENKPNDLKNYFKIIEIEPRKLDIYLHIGKILLEKEEIVSATVVLQIAHHIYPQDNNVSLLLKQALGQQQKINNYELTNISKRQSDSNDEVNFTSAMSFFQIGELLKREKKISQAALCFEKAVALQPDSYKFHHELGNVYREQKQFELAVEEAKLTIELKPNFVWAYHNMGRAFECIGSINEAINSYNNALEIDPNLEVSRKALNKLLNSQQEKEIKEYQKLAKEKMQSGDLEEAKTIYEKAIALQPENHDLYHNLGNIYREQGDIENAVAQAQKTIEIKPDFYWGHHNLGRALEMKGLKEQAIESYYNALKIKPDLKVSIEKIERLKTN